MKQGYRCLQPSFATRIISRLKPLFQMSQKPITRPHPENIDMQLERLFDRDHVVRGAAAKHLGMMEDKADREDILRALARMARHDWDRRCKINALVALRKIGNPKAVPMLRIWQETLTLGLLFTERWQDVRAELKKTRKYLKSMSAR